MTGWLIGSGCVLAIVGGPLVARWAGWRWHGWRLCRVHAQHAGGQFVDEPPEQDFYGSMIRDEERDWATRFLPADPVPYRDLQRAERIEAPDWRTQTMAELGALADPGPGVVAPSHGPPPGPVPSGCVVPSSPKTAPIGAGSPGNENRDRDAYATFDQFYADTRAFERLAHTGDIYGARLGLGPRAAAVLERYEQRRQERWALA